MCFPELHKVNAKLFGFFSAENSSEGNGKMTFPFRCHLQRLILGKLVQNITFSPASLFWIVTNCRHDQCFLPLNLNLIPSCYCHDPILNEEVGGRSQCLIDFLDWNWNGPNSNFCKVELLKHIDCVTNYLMILVNNWHLPQIAGLDIS